MGNSQLGHYSQGHVPINCLLPPPHRACQATHGPLPPGLPPPPGPFQGAHVRTHACRQACRRLGATVALTVLTVGQAVGLFVRACL